MAHGGPVYRNPTLYLTCEQRCCQVLNVSFEIHVVNVVATFPWKAQTETFLALERTEFQKMDVKLFITKSSQT